VKIVVAPDAFKGSLSAPAVAEALAAGLRAGLPQAVLDLAPMADGGEGTSEALVAATGGSLREAQVTGPLGERVSARYGLLGDGVTAVVDTAAASGLTLVAPDSRDPLRATTRGTGELILQAVAAGCRRVIVGLGGSATVDGGAGLAQALGFRLLDGHGRELGPGGGSLTKLARIDGAWPSRGEVELVAACDVTNPLLGSRGAAAVYGPQKGACPQAVVELEAGLTRLAEVLRSDLGVEVRELKGGGAAGGLGAGLVGFLGARLTSGVELVCEAIGLEARLREADLVVTGEGRVDGQTAHAKAPLGVARLAARLGVPAVVVGGGVDPAAYALLEAEFAAILGIPDRPLTLDEAVADAAGLLRRAGEELGRLLALGGRLGAGR
jgi:glycerate kinase